MPNVVGVRFRPVTKIYYFLPLANTPLKFNDPVIIQTSRGQELGWIASEEKHITQKEVKGTLKPVVRPATPLDLLKMQESHTQEPIALQKCKEKASELGLPIKVVQAEYSYDGTRLVFSFTAEQRVDFRNLVRVLVRSLRAKVEMRQIGARDEAKIIDGFGRCGRQFCCSSWLTEFHPVSIRMAKNQQLPLAPAEISGVCGRLLCCLAYEDYLYTESRKKLPKTGTQVETPEGIGQVRGLNVLKESVIIALESGTRQEYMIDDIQVIAPLPKKETAKKKDAKKKDARKKRKSQPKQKKNEA